MAARSVRESAALRWSIVTRARRTSNHESQCIASAPFRLWVQKGPIPTSAIFLLTTTICFPLSSHSSFLLHSAPPNLCWSLTRPSALNARLGPHFSNSYPQEVTHLTYSDQPWASTVSPTHLALLQQSHPLSDASPRSHDPQLLPDTCV